MRQFYLTNGNGARYSLMDTAHWLYEPKGLGLKFGSKYEQAGSNFIRTKTITKPKDVSGTIMFTGKDRYEHYSEFAHFIQIEPLTLIYNPDGNEYQAQVEIIELEKSEIDAETRILQCDIDIKRMSRWRKIIIQRNDNDVIAGKVYPYTYDYTYGKDIANNVTIESDTAYESPCKITIIGICTNPVWRLYSNGDLISTGKVYTDLIAGERIVIDTTTIPFSIKKMDASNNLIADLYQLSDFSTPRFFFLKKGKNRISIGHDGVTALELAVEAHLEYETV